MAFVDTIGGIVMGRGAFETERRMVPWNYEDLPVLVMTNRPIDDPRPGVVTASGDPALALSTCKPRVRRGDIWLFGGGIVAGGFLAAGLIDRIEVEVVTVALGMGRGLFAGASAQPRLRLLESQADGSVVRSVYVPG